MSIYVFINTPILNLRSHMIDTYQYMKSENVSNSFLVKNNFLSLSLSPTIASKPALPGGLCGGTSLLLTNKEMVVVDLVFWTPLLTQLCCKGSEIRIQSPFERPSLVISMYKKLSFATIFFKTKMKSPGKIHNGILDNHIQDQQTILCRFHYRFRCPKQI